MKRKILGISPLAWIITIAIVLLCVFMMVFDVVLHIALGILCVSFILFLIYLVALCIDCLLN